MEAPSSTRAGNARVRRGMIQLAWRFLLFQKQSALTLSYRVRTADSRAGTRKTMIVALARKLLIPLPAEQGTPHVRVEDDGDALNAWRYFL